MSKKCDALRQVRVHADLYRRVQEFARTGLQIEVTTVAAANWLIRRGLREVDNQPEKENQCPPTKKTKERSKK